jgi:hypothetical protein
MWARIKRGVHRGVGDEVAAHLFVVVKNEAAEEEVEAAQPLEVAAEEEHAARDQLVHLLQLQDGEAIPTCILHGQTKTAVIGI